MTFLPLEDYLRQSVMSNREYNYLLPIPNSICGRFLKHDFRRNPEILKGMK